MIKAIEEARAKHWSDLASLADKIVKWWRKYCFEEPHYPSAYILDDPDFETVNYMLAQALLAHLKAEFAECRGMTDWKELVATDLKSDIVVSMRLVAFRRTFVGSCEICQSWANAATAGAPYGVESGGRLPAVVGVLTQEVIDSLLRIKRYRRLKESSLETYEKHYAVFAKEFPLLPTDQDTILNYLERFDGKSGRTRLNWQAQLNMLYRHASEKFHVPNPIAGLPRPRITHRPVKAMSLIEASLLDTTPTTLRERAALDLLLGHGWRQIEVRRTTVDDVRNIRDGTIWVRGKERDEYTPILSETQARLIELAEGLESEDRIFRGPRYDLGEDGMTKLIRRLYTRASLTDICGHDLRRTFATMVREASRDEFLAMRLIRDKIPGQNDRYLAVTPVKLREALEKYSPLRLITTVSPAGETGECLVETGESRTPRPEEAVQDILQA